MGCGLKRTWSRTGLETETWGLSLGLGLKELGHGLGLEVYGLGPDLCLALVFLVSHSRLYLISVNILF